MDLSHLVNHAATADFGNNNNHRDNGKSVMSTDHLPWENKRLKTLILLNLAHPDEDTRAKAMRTLIKEFPGNDGPNGKLNYYAAMAFDELEGIAKNPSNEDVKKISLIIPASYDEQHKGLSGPAKLTYEQRIKLQNENPGNPLFEFALNDLAYKYASAKTPEGKKAVYNELKSKYPGSDGPGNDISMYADDMINEYQSALADNSTYSDDYFGEE